MAFSEKLSQLMEVNAITNYRLAKDIGVHASTVKNWLIGVTPNIGHVKKVADYFEVSIKDLIL